MYQPAAVGCVVALVPDDRFVDSRPVHIAAQEIVFVVDFANHRRAVIEEARDHRAVGFVEPPGRIVGEARRAGADKAVIDIVGKAASETTMLNPSQLWNGRKSQTRRRINSGLAMCRLVPH